MRPSICRAPIVCLVGAFVCTLAAATVGAQSRAPLVATLTFGAPVQVPGAILPAGTYVFRQIGGVIGHGLVQISSVRPKRVVTQFRTRVIGRTVEGDEVTFRPTLNGSPAIATWYFNKGIEGSEFVYSTSELHALATPPTGAVTANAVAPAAK